MRGMALLLCVSFLPHARADTEVTLSTDRPSVADWSPVVPRGGLQVESGMQATDNAGQWTLDLPETLVRYGLIENTELRLVVPNYYLHLPAGSSTTHEVPSHTSLTQRVEGGDVCGRASAFPTIIFKTQRFDALVRP